MKHIKKYPLNEELIWDPKTQGKELEKNPDIKKWLQKVVLDDDWFDPNGHNNIITPYGEVIELDFHESGEYNGDGWWDFVSRSIPDQYGITYFCPGGNKSRSYVHPEEIFYEEEGIEGTFNNIEFNPVKFITGLIEKQPLICSKVYNLCSQEWKDSVLESLKSKGIGLDTLKGGSTLTRFGLEDDI